MTMAAAMLTLLSCKDKKPEDKGIIKTDYVAPKPTGPKATAVNSVTESIEWIEGRRYRVNINGHGEETLPMVQDENGQQYIDNAIRVEVTRADSTLFYGHTFTKESFTEWLNKDYRKNAILTDINFLEPEGNVLKFVVSLNYPEASDDEALDLLLLLDSQGNTSIKPFTYNERDDLEVIDQE